MYVVLTSMRGHGQSCSNGDGEGCESKHDDSCCVGVKRLMKYSAGQISYIVLVDSVECSIMV